MDLTKTELKPTDTNPMAVRGIKLFHPTPIADRIRLQESVFTVEPVPIFPKHGKPGRLETILIPASSIRSIREGLRKMGISQETLRPSLDSLAMDIANETTQLLRKS